MNCLANLLTEKLLGGAGRRLAKPPELGLAELEAFLDEPLLNKGNGPAGPIILVALFECSFTTTSYGEK